MAHFRVCIIGGGVTAMFYLATYRPDTGLKGIRQKIKRESQHLSLEELSGAVEEKDKFSDHLLWAPLNPWVIGKKEYKHVGRGDDYGMGQSPWINSLKKPSEFNYSTNLQTREAFYEEQSAILYRAEKKQGLTYHHGVVEKLEIIPHEDSFRWKITGYHFSEGSSVKKEVTADKILLMTGTGEEAKPALEKAEKEFQDYWCKVFNLPRWPSQAERDAWPRIFQASATWGLNERQRGVLQLAANGMLAKDIAERLGLGGESAVKDILKEIIKLASAAEQDAIQEAIKNYEGKTPNELVGIVQWILWNRF